MKIEITIESQTDFITPSELIDALIKELQVMPPEIRIDGSSAYDRGLLRLSIRRDDFITNRNPYFN